jgi:hypothetical protein
MVVRSATMIFANSMDRQLTEFDSERITLRRIAVPHFRLIQLFALIDDELASKRYVIISLNVPGGWHNYVIYNRLPNAEYEAVTKAQPSEHIADVRQRVINMGGTDILTYEMIN